MCFPHIQFIPTTIIDGPVNLFNVEDGGGWFFDRLQDSVPQWTVSSKTRCKACVNEIKYNELMSVYRSISMEYSLPAQGLVLFFCLLFFMSILENSPFHLEFEAVLGKNFFPLVLHM